MVRLDQLSPQHLKQLLARLGELLGLRCQDVDLEEGVVVVCQTLVKEGGSRSSTSPGTETHGSCLSRPRWCRPCGERAWSRKSPELAWSRPAYGTEPSQAMRIGEKANKKAEEEQNEAAKLPAKLRFQDLRHTFVSRPLQAGANPREVSETVGHYDPGFTLKRYARALPEDTKEAVQRLAGYLRRTASAQDGQE